MEKDDEIINLNDIRFSVKDISIFLLVAIIILLVFLYYIHTGQYIDLLNDYAKNCTIESLIR